MSEIELYIKKQLLIVAANNYNKNIKEIKEIVNNKFDEKIEMLVHEIKAKEFVELNNNKSKIVDDVMDKIKRYREEERQKEIAKIEEEKAIKEERKKQEQQEKELLKQAKEELKEEERKRQAKRVLIISIIGSIIYIITIIYATTNYYG